MIKNLLVLVFLVSIFSCSKQTVDKPAASIQTSSTPISYQSGNIYISNFQATQANAKVTVSFSTSFQKDIKTLEILRGMDANNLCSIYKTDGSAYSTSSLSYSTNDEREGVTLYYIVKYTLKSNDWGYTPMFTLQQSTH